LLMKLFTPPRHCGLDPQSHHIIADRLRLGGRNDGSGGGAEGGVNSVYGSDCTDENVYIPASGINYQTLNSNQNVLPLPISDMTP